MATQGGLDWYTQDRFVRLAATPATDDVLARRFAEDSTGNLYTTNAPRGISRIKNKELVFLDNKLNLMNMLESPDGNLWFSSQEGMILTTAPDLAEFGNSRRSLTYEQIDRADGLLTAQASVGSPNIAMTPDGKVWVG